MSAVLKTINLEEGLPSVAQASARLTSELQLARRNCTFALKIIHGYGSTGVGGDLRIALQSLLHQMEDRGEIQSLIYGENWRKADERAWKLVKRYPQLKNDRDFGAGNRGITIVVL